MIRRIKQADIKKISDMLNRVPNFTETEVDVAMELVNIAGSNSVQTDYNVFVYEDEQKIFGYHCIGQRPLTDAVFDLYWIVTDPDKKGNGIGKSLLEHAEKFVKDKKGRWLLAETSSKDNYSATRNFYLRNNYSIIAEINDFYSQGDSLIVFGKFFKYN